MPSSFPEKLDERCLGAYNAKGFPKNTRNQVI